MRAMAIQITPSDYRYFKVEDGFRYGVYLEKDQPAPGNSRVNLCVYRVPTGTQAPAGRISDADLMKLANEGLKEVPPQVIARYPYWMTIFSPDDLATADLQVDLNAVTYEDQNELPASGTDRYGSYIEPADAFKPIVSARAAHAAERAAAKDAEKPEKGGG